ILLDGPKWVVRNLPRMSVGVGKIPGVTTPKDFLRFLQDCCAIVFQSSKDCVDLLLALNIVSKGIAAVVWQTNGRKTHVLRQLVVWPKSEYNSVQIKEDNSRRACFCLPTNHALVESHRTLQISDTKRD